MRVTATEKGFYGGEIKKPGEEFSLASADDFSERWMAPAADVEPVSGEETGSGDESGDGEGVEPASETAGDPPAEDAPPAPRGRGRAAR